MTVKEFRDCRRRFARARAWVSPSGIRARSGFGEGRISKSGEERVTLDEMGLRGESARARQVSGEHGTFRLGGMSAPSPSLSLVGLVDPLSGSSLGVSAVQRPPLSSNRWQKVETDCGGLMGRWGLPGTGAADGGFGFEHQGLWTTGADAWSLPGGLGLGFGTRSGCGLDQGLGLLLAVQSRSSRFSVL